MKKWILTLMLLVFASRLEAYNVPYETWMGAYVGEKKAGYVSIKIDKAEFNGIKGYRIASAFSTKLAVLGVELTQLVNTNVLTDDKFAPLEENFSMSSGGKTTKVIATFNKDTIDCVISAGSGSSQKQIPIPAGTNLVGDSMFGIIGKQAEVGQEYKFDYFNPLTLAIEQVTVKAERKEKLTIGGKQYDTVVVQNITPMGDMTMWQTPDGDIAQVTAMMGIKMIRQSKEEAMAGVDGGTPEDFAILTCIKPGRSIPSPRECKSMTAVLRGAPEDIPTDYRQKITAVKNAPGTVRLNNSTPDFDAATSRNLPISDARFADYLASTPYLDSNVKEIEEQTKSIVGDEKNAYKACCKIRGWINANLRPQSDIGITRCASDVLKSKVGVCRDYAILFAALARSAGIPARIASGVLFTDGAFYYHAWTECYVGKWVPLDATLKTDFVDATHIKLAEGDATSMFGLARVIGSLKIDVKSTK